MISPVEPPPINSGSGPDSSWRLTSSVLVSITSMMSPSPAATQSSLKSGLRTMPRGRRETLIVLIVSSVSLLSTVIVLSFSFETKLVAAAAGAAAGRGGARRALDRLDRLERVAVEHVNRIVLLVRDEDRRGGSRGRTEKERGAQGDG